MDDLDVQMEGFISHKGGNASPYKAVGGTECHGRRGVLRLPMSFDPCRSVRFCTLMMLCRLIWTCE